MFLLNRQLSSSVTYWLMEEKVMVYGIIGCKYYSIYSCINVQVAFVLRATSGFTNPTPHSI